MVNPLNSFADALVLLHGWRRWLAAFLAGLASALALPPVFFAPILIVTLSVLVVLLDGADADPAARGNSLLARLFSPAFAVGWWFGFGYFLGGLYWITEALQINAEAHGWLIPFALGLIPGGLALFIAVPCALAGMVWGTGFARVGWLACLLSLGELVRGVVLSGFPWNGFHSALGLHDTLLQGMALGGASLASLLVLLVGMTPAALWPRAMVGRGSFFAVALCVLALAGWSAYGVVRLAGSADLESVPGVQLRIVQPNIAQADKWDPAQANEHFSTLLRLTMEGSDNGPSSGEAAGLGLLGATHVIWPESAFPFLLTRRPDALAAIGQALPLGAQMLAGAIRAEPRGETQVFYNAVYALNDRGEIVDAYDKVRLVPFGEMLPFGDLIDRLGVRPLVSAPAGFQPGTGPGALGGIGGPRGLALVCYEIIFPGFVRQGVNDHAPDYLLNVTNDAWFGSSAGPFQHFFQARLRAVELGLPVVRAANTGISGTIDAYGRVQASLGIEERGVVDTGLPPALEATPYRRWGGAGFWLILGLVLSNSIYYLRLQKSGFA